MTPDPEAYAALDIWFEHGNCWRDWEDIEILCARMRRVLDAHDAGNPNTLPMDALPEGVVFSTLVFFEDIELWRVTLMSPIGVPDCVPLYSVGEGPTPRAAMRAAIEAAKEGK